MKEESAQVVKTYIPSNYPRVPSSIEDKVWNKAMITVKAIKNDHVKEIDALICINKNKVLAVADGYRECWGSCMADKVIFQDIQVCMPFVSACLADPSKTSCAALGACAGGLAGICATDCAVQKYGDDVWDAITGLF